MTALVADTTAVASDLVVLVVPGETSYLGVLRTATAGMAARLQMTLDEIEDLRIAVDEACAILIPLAVRGSEVTCRFTVTADSLCIEVSVPASDTDKLPGNSSFSWQVLTALAGQVSADGRDGYATIRLTKRRHA